MATPPRRRRRTSSGVPRQRRTRCPARTRRPARRHPAQPLRIPPSLRTVASYLHGWACIGTTGTVLILWPWYLAAALLLLWFAADRWNKHRTALRSRVPDTAGLAQYRALTPDAFEHAIADLARRSPDVARAIRVGGANDRTLDVLVVLRDGRRILLRCKRYAPGTWVGSAHIQVVNGDLHRCDLAAIVTTSGFTRQAVETNAALPVPIRLVDGPGLLAWARGGPPPWA